MQCLFWPEIGPILVGLWLLLPLLLVTSEGGDGFFLSFHPFGPKIFQDVPDFTNLGSSMKLLHITYWSWINRCPYRMNGISEGARTFQGWAGHLPFSHCRVRNAWILITLIWIFLESYFSGWVRNFLGGEEKKKDDLNWEGGEFKVRNIVSFSFTVESFKPPMKTLETAFSFQSCGGGFRSRSFPMHATCWSQKCH